jgi:hypothetical protein
MPNHELFHTEDCGLSLLCRCCRGPVCAQRLSKADRMAVNGGLWRYTCRARHDDRSLANYSNPPRRRVSDWFLRMIRWLQPFIDGKTVCI